MFDNYLPLIFGIFLLVLAWVTGRLAKFFNDKATDETESKALFLVWKLGWLGAVTGLVASLIFAFLSIMPYFEQLMGIIIAGVYFK